MKKASESKPQTFASSNNAAFLMWRAFAIAVIRELAQGTRAFSTDDIWVKLDTVPRPKEPRALGAVLTAGRDQGIIAKSPFVVASKRPDCHSRPIAVWLSVPLGATYTDASEYVAKQSRDLTLPIFASAPARAAEEIFGEKN